MNNFIPDIDSHLSSFIICSIIWLSFAFLLVRRYKSKRNAVKACKFLEVLSRPDLIRDFERIVKDCRSNQNLPSRNNLLTVYRECIEKAINNDFVENKAHKINIGSPSFSIKAIYDHLLNIFLAGSFESRLETEALLKHTELKLFKDSVILKNLLSTFIVIGLLGTLIGLGESLSLFDDTSSKMTELVRMQLPEAFKPSIAGVICTILGMIFYSRLVHTYYTPLKTSLEDLTLNVWLPKLYPVFTERLIDKLEDNAKRIEEQFASAAKVADFARNIELESSLFHKNISLGSELICRIEPAVNEFGHSAKTIKQFADKLNKFAENFAKGMDTFKGYEEKLATKYEMLSDSNMALTANLSDWVANFDAVVKHYNTQIGTIADSNNNIFASIINFEEQYLDSSKEHVDVVTDLIKTIKREKESDVVKNREITEKILVESSDKFAQILSEMGQLTNTLGFNLGKIDDSLTSRLGNVDVNLIQNLNALTSHVTKSLADMQAELTRNLQSIPLKLEEHNTKIITQFDKYDAPVRIAADKIEGSYSGMVSGIQSLIKQFHNSMETHNSNLETHFATTLSAVTIELKKNEEKLSVQEQLYSRLTLAIETLNKNITELKPDKKPFWKS